MSLPFAEQAARCRQAQQVWRETLLRQRLRCVRELRHLLVEQAETLALTVTQDVGRPADEVFVTDILPSADACAFLENQAQRILKPRRIPGPQRPLWLFGSRDVVHRRPRGVVGIIGTWNYPLFLNIVPIVQALTAGNGVLWKPSELTPMLATALHGLFLQAGFPADLFQALPATREAGPELAEAVIDHIVFTGSADVGRKLAARLGERLISSTLELSGCDAMIVLADANIAMAAKAAWFGVTLNKGQTCLAVRRIFVDRSVYPAFLEQLRTLAAESHQQPLMLFSQATQAERLVRAAVDEGASLLLAGQPPTAADDPPRFVPTFVVDARPEMAICREASFAPIAAIIPFANFADLVAMQADCSYGLAASIFTADAKQAQRLASVIDTGMITINDVIAQTAHPATPFGGHRQSGWGVTQGAEGLLEMTLPQVVSVRRGSFRPHFAGTQPATTELLKRMIRWRHGRRFPDRLKGFFRMLRAARSFGSPKAN